MAKKKATAAPKTGAASSTKKAAPRKKPATKVVKEVPVTEEVSDAASATIESPVVSETPSATETHMVKNEAPLPQEDEPVSPASGEDAPPAESNEPSPDLSGRVVVIPYLAKAAAGNEILLAIRSWEQNYPDLESIVIVGDLPAQLQGKVAHIPHRQASENPQIDVAQKMAAAIASDLVPETFIWSNDDIFVMAPLSFEDIAAKRCMTRPLMKRGLAGGVYRENTERTVEALHKAGIHNPKDYATHTPFVFRKTALAEILGRYKCTAEGHLVSCLYFNTLYPLARPVSVDNGVNGTVVASVFKSNPDREALDKVVGYKQYLNCNNHGWPHVERHLLRRFGKKSKFEI
jgi:hypothetical protein